MSRLTIKSPENPTYISDEDAVQIDDEFGVICYTGSAVDKLAAYEDKGEPEELVKVVRCKKCMYKITDETFGIYCEMFGMATINTFDDDFYCRYGEEEQNG